MSVQTSDGIVHLVMINETKYEYGRTACRLDFVHQGRAVPSETVYAVVTVVGVPNPFSCLYCAIAPPYGSR